MHLLDNFSGNYKMATQDGTSGIVPINFDCNSFGFTNSLLARLEHPSKAHVWQISRPTEHIFDLFALP